MPLSYHTACHIFSQQILLEPSQYAWPEARCWKPSSKPIRQGSLPSWNFQQNLKKTQRNLKAQFEGEERVALRQRELKGQRKCVCRELRDFQSILGLTHREYLTIEGISATRRQLERLFIPTRSDQRLDFLIPYMQLSLCLEWCSVPSRWSIHSC